MKITTKIPIVVMTDIFKIVKYKNSRSRMPQMKHFNNLKTSNTKNRSKNARELTTTTI